MLQAGCISSRCFIVVPKQGDSLFTINTDIFGATEVYTLINSRFGALDDLNGRLEFVGTGGAFASFDLIQGLNIRNHFIGNPGFNNIVSDPTIETVEFGASAILDRQTFVLPDLFTTQSLTEIRLIGLTGTLFGNDSEFFEGAAFPAAVTVETADASMVPEPSSLVMMLGFGAVGLVGWTRRRRSGQRQPSAG